MSFRAGIGEGTVIQGNRRRRPKRRRVPNPAAECARLRPSGTRTYKIWQGGRRDIRADCLAGCGGRWKTARRPSGLRKARNR